MMYRGQIVEETTADDADNEINLGCILYKVKF